MATLFLRAVARDASAALDVLAPGPLKVVARNWVPRKRHEAAVQVKDGVARFRARKELEKKTDVVMFETTKRVNDERNKT